MHYHIEYGGGLGDVFYQIYQASSYNVLRTMGPEDHATVVLITHNPCVRELFTHHPKAAQIEIRDLGYWLPEQDGMMRAKHRLPDPKPDNPKSTGTIDYYPSADDLRTLDELPRVPWVIFSVSAGIAERSLPVWMSEALARLVKARGLLPVFVGRSYDRHGRKEHRPETPGVIDLIDRLTVPGVARAVERAVGVVCCHSSINMLAWLIRKPQLLLYPRSADERHIVHRDQWAFGIDFPECRHTRFNDENLFETAEEFIDIVRAQGRHSAPAACGLLRDRVELVSTEPLPAESQIIRLDETIDRLTPLHEVKYLCWLADQVGGNVVEIGCNKGLTTRDLACANPSRIIYAVDYLGEEAFKAQEQRGERISPHDFCCRARGLRNVVCLHAPSHTLNYEALQNVKLIFIDGDHTFEAVKADSDRALAYLRKHGGTLVWHDYYESAPAWVGVKRFVDSLTLKITRIDQTWLAVARIPAG